MNENTQRRVEAAAVVVGQLKESHAARTAAEAEFQAGIQASLERLAGKICPGLPQLVSVADPLAAKQYYIVDQDGIWHSGNPRQAPKLVAASPASKRDFAADAKCEPRQREQLAKSVDRFLEGFQDAVAELSAGHRQREQLLKETRANLERLLS